MKTRFCVRSDKSRGSASDRKLVSNVNLLEIGLATSTRLKVPSLLLITRSPLPSMKIQGVPLLCVTSGKRRMAGMFPDLKFQHGNSGDVGRTSVVMNW
jgi:hypothetical protein